MHIYGKTMCYLAWKHTIFLALNCTFLTSSFVFCINKTQPVSKIFECIKNIALKSLKKFCEKIVLI